MRLAGKVVVVTGGSVGIGEAIARVFAGEGAKLVLLARDAARAEAARQRIGQTDNSLAFSCDVGKREDIDRALNFALDRFKRVDVWVNNAGHGLKDFFAGMDIRACRDLFDTNFFGVVNGMQAVIPVMKKQGSGAIINISSIAGHIPAPTGAAYSASKFAVNAIGKAARIELHKWNINVLTVCPGFVQTDFPANLVAGEHHKGTPPRNVRRISADRVARAVLSGYLRDKREVIVPWTMIPVVKLYQLFPGLVEWALLRRKELSQP
jgi:NADP-dependent 3-hydroxy acid dehydrogenase YdfG